VFWTCHSDVILAMGREGVTWNSVFHQLQEKETGSGKASRLIGIAVAESASSTKKEKATENLHHHSSAE
jgi:hypothetical protein